MAWPRTRTSHRRNDSGETANVLTRCLDCLREINMSDGRETSNKTNTAAWPRSAEHGWCVWVKQA